VRIHTASRILIVLSLLSIFSSAQAEKADKQKVSNIKSELFTLDNVANITTFTGNVIYTQGTIIAKASKAVSKEGADGMKFVVMYSGGGKPVFFRQKRDGGENLWIEGIADRVEYDQKTELVKFIAKANIKYLDGTRVTQEFNGDFFSYDSHNDYFLGTNSITGERVPDGGQTNVMSQPKTENTQK
jgi:lipopolysaccharide export system protein LptA